MAKVKGTSKLLKCLSTRKFGAISLNGAIHSFDFPCITQYTLLLVHGLENMTGFASTLCLQILKQPRPNVMCHVSKLLCCLLLANH
jgi:hypothetical protein